MADQRGASGAHLPGWRQLTGDADRERDLDLDRDRDRERHLSSSSGQRRRLLIVLQLSEWPGVGGRPALQGVSAAPPPPPRHGRVQPLTTGRRRTDVDAPARQGEQLSSLTGSSAAAGVSRSPADQPTDPAPTLQPAPTGADRRTRHNRCPWRSVGRSAGRSGGRPGDDRMAALAEPDGTRRPAGDRFRRAGEI